jgi:hypothetical protein
MANVESVSGVDSYVLIGKQTAFGSEQATCATHLGLIKSFKPRTTNTNSYSRGFKGTTTGGRNVAKIIPGVAESTIDIEMDVINWSFMEYVMGSSAGSGTVTYSEADQPPYFTLHRCIANPGTSATQRDEIWLDCVIDSVSIRCATNGAVSASLTIKSSQRKYDATVLSTAALPTIDVFNFVNSSISISGSAVSNIIDSCDVTINNNHKTHAGLGSRFIRAIRAAERDYKAKFTVKYLDDSLIVKVLGAAAPTGTTQPTSNANIALVFGNNSSKTATFTLSTFVFDDISNAEELNSLIGEDLSGTAQSGAVVEVQ